MIVAASLVGAACRSSSSGNPDSNNNTTDAPPGTADAPVGPDGAVAGCMGVYAPSSVAAMRQGTATGCFELDNVVSIALTPSKGSPTLYVQDSGGGAFSAMRTKCSSTSTAHPCTVATQVAAIALGHSVTVKGTYIKSKSTGYEIFYIDSVADNGAGTLPTAGAAVIADIERGGTNRGLAFQRVTLTISASDPLQMYDWTPSEFVYTGATKCPYQFAFGMIPKSANQTATAACTSGTAQPTGQATPNAAEVLIGTDFYTGFAISSDCRCAKMYSDMEPAAGSKLSGPVSGILVFDVPFGGTVGYNYLAPQSGADAPITATVPGM
jgi:hypothetical protein